MGVINHIELLGNADLIEEALKVLRKEYGDNDVAASRPTETACDAFVMRPFPVAGLRAKLEDQFPELVIRAFSIPEEPWDTPEALELGYNEY